jgi:hypothetical protein
MSNLSNPGENSKVDVCVVKLGDIKKNNEVPIDVSFKCDNQNNM